MPRTRLLLAAAAAAALASVPTAAASAHRAAANPASGICLVKTAGIKGGKVTVGVNIDDADSTAVDHGSCRVVEHVVRHLVRIGAERPERVAAYRCTPSVTGRKVAWTCTYRGGKPRTTVTLAFAYRLRAGS